MTRTAKPLLQRAYGSIPHLPGSRRGPADKGLSESQASILTWKSRDKNDRIIVQEKLDGSCVGVARIDGELVPITRAGYAALSSPFPMHHRFHEWAKKNEDRFWALLNDGERAMGEWLDQAHGTRYDLPHEPFVLFDVMYDGHKRMPYACVLEASFSTGFTMPQKLHDGGPIGVAEVMSLISRSGHGAIDPVEGAVWRCERKGAVDFLGKYVRKDKVDGKYLPSVTGGPEVMNTWRG